LQAKQIKNSYQQAAMGTGTWGMRDKFKFYQKNLEV
jgi:hypothetical protein